MAVTVATRGGPRHPRYTVPGVEVLRLPARGDSRPLIALGLLRVALRLLVEKPRRLARAISAVRRGDEGLPLRQTLAMLADVLPILLARPGVAHFEWESAAVRFLPLFEALGCPVVVSVRGSGINVNPYAGEEGLAAAYESVFARAAAVHCVSEAVRDEAAQFGLDRAKARVIHPAVDPDYFRPPPEPSSQREVLRVVGIGELNWIKGYGDALEAIAALVRDGVPVSYEILGGEPGPDSGKASDRARLLYLIHELGLEGRVRLLGDVSEEVVRRELQASDVLLHASLSEGLPNAVLEAMACARPVVVTDCGGLREAVEHGVEGLVCPRRSPEALADALRSLRDRSLGRSMGDAGRARVVADFTLEHQIESFRHLYEGIVDVTRAP